MPEIWILGATGRVGRAVAARLAGGGAELALVGRNPERLAEVAAIAGGARVVRAGSLADITALIRVEQPDVVVNTIGPFVDSATPVIDACLPGSHYLDVGNELPALSAVLARHQDAITAGRTLVAGTGFGVLGTESAALTAVAGSKAVEAIRVDGMPLVAPEPEPLGQALAASIIGALAAGGLRYSGGHLVRAGIGSHIETITTPDGTTFRTGSAPTGELEAARRASGAPNVLAASAMVPTGLPVRALLTVAAPLLRFGPLRRLLIQRMAAFEGSPRPASNRKFTWARARVRTTDGRTRTAWLRADDAMDFTVASTAEVASRLVRGEGRPGAYTPGALFGAELAEAAGGTVMMD